MIFNYARKFEIEDPNVAGLDSVRSQLRTDLIIYQDQICNASEDVYPSMTTERRIRESARCIIQESKKIKRNKLNLFDRLVVEDILCCGIKAGDYIKYSTEENDLSPAQLLASLFGNASYSKIIFAIKKENWPHDLIDELSRRTAEMKPRIDSDDIMEFKTPLSINLRQKLEKLVNNRKPMADRFCELTGVTSGKPEDYNIELAPASYWFSYWDGVSQKVAISPDYIFCYRPENSQDFQFFPGLLNLTAVHEVAGHRNQEVLSKKTMPPGLQGDNTRYLPIFTGANSEGVAMAMEYFSLKEMEKNPKEWGLTTEEVGLTKLFRRAYVAKKLFQQAYALFDLQYRWSHEELANSPDHLKRHGARILAKKSGMNRFTKDPNCLSDPALDGVLSKLIYFFGQRDVMGVVQKLEEKKVPQEIIMSGISHAFWSNSNLLERFIFDLYLPKVMS